MAGIGEQDFQERDAAAIGRIGVANAGPLYAAFPVAAVMLKKGTSLFNVILFIGAWATLKIPMFLFEMQFLGVPFSVTRWVCSLIGILLIAFVTDRMHSEAEKQAIYAKHQELQKCGQLNNC